MSPFPESKHSLAKPVDAPRQNQVFEGKVSVKAPNKLSNKTQAFTPSKEQDDIVKACATSNVMVSARPGSGKTTTIKAILQDNPSTSMVVITYSKRLQVDTLNKLMPYGFEEDDKVLLDLRQKNARPTWRSTVDLVVLDEVQDMNENLYWLTCAFLATVSRNQENPPRLLCLGDPNQAIYEFKGADSRYLQLAEDAFKDVNPYPWEKLSLPKSFRLSHQTAAFVNTLITGTEKIEGSHDGPMPIYLHADLDDAESLLKKVRPLIEQYTPE
ncbi:687_t:CDS:2, partial [Acaulospora colombiana]